MTDKRGQLIAFVGPKGAGKSWLLKYAAAYLESKGHKVAIFKEPGDTELGEQVRRLLRSGWVKNPWAKVFMLSAARAELVNQYVVPALLRGEVVLVDRFVYCTLVYQGHELGLDVLDRELLELCCAALRVPSTPAISVADLVIMPDTPVDVCVERVLSRVEPWDAEFKVEDQEIIHQRYRQLAKAYGDWALIQHGPQDSTLKQLYDILDQHMEENQTWKSD